MLAEESIPMEAAVEQVLKEGYRTADIYSEMCKKVSTAEMGDLIAERIGKEKECAAHEK